MSSSSESECDPDQYKRDASLVKGATLIRLLNIGGSGRIYKAKDKNDGRIIAVKIVDYLEESNKEEAMEEPKIHSMLEHKNIIKLYKYYTKDNSLIMHLEYINGHDVFEMINMGIHVCREEAKRISDEVLSALKYMHEKDITHNDVHDGNVMVSDDGDVKLVDFGCATFHASSKLPDILRAESICERLFPSGSVQDGIS